MGQKEVARQQCRNCPNLAVQGEHECIKCLMEPKRKSHKYKAEPTTVDGIRFDSKFESERYAELKTLAAAGAITDLVLQPSFDLIVDDVVVARMVLDFSYRTPHRGEPQWSDRFHPLPLVVEDVKGVRTRIYRLKKKMFEAQYGIQISEIMRPKKKVGRAKWRIKK